MALIPRKTYPELTALTAPVVDGDVLAVYRSPGPLRRTTVSTFADYIKAFFSASGGSALVGFLQAGTGAVARTAQAKMRDVITDADFSTLQQALTAAAGKVLLITQAHTTAAGFTPAANTTIRGHGGSITVTAAGVNGINITDDGIILDGVRIIGPGASAEPADFTLGNGIHGVSADNVTVRNCIVSGFNSCGILLRGCTSVIVDGNLLYNNTYNSPYAVGDVSDICLYSPTACGKAIIANNRCMSNNSQGIYVSALGYDSDITVSGNLCVACNADGFTETTGAAVRRHGIVVGYATSAGSGRVVVVGNVIRNSSGTGIYVASTTNLVRAIEVTGNIISKVGFGTVQPTLNGGIFVNGGGIGTVISSNAIYDFQGAFASIVGAITISASISGNSGSIIGNTIDTSTANGIVLKSSTSGWLVDGNQISGCAGYDIFENPGAGVTNGGHEIINNTTRRTNANYSSIFIEFSTSTRTTRVCGNTMYGFDTTSANSCGLTVRNATTDRRVIAEHNLAKNFNVGILLNENATGRFINLTRIDFNHLEDCQRGIAVFGSSSTLCFVAEGNSFVNCTNKFYQVFAENAFAGYRLDDTVVLAPRAATPTTGTWVVGDRAIGPGAVGQPKAWTCTTAGSPGTWTSEGNL